MRALATKYGAPNLGLAITELGPSYQGTSATAGLFAADSYLTWWENGVFNTDGFDLRSGSDVGTVDYGEVGIVSTGGTNMLPLNTPYPASYGLSMASAPTSIAYRGRFGSRRSVRRDLQCSSVGALQITAMW